MEMVHSVNVRAVAMAESEMNSLSGQFYIWKVTKSIRIWVGNRRIKIQGELLDPKVYTYQTDGPKGLLSHILSDHVNYSRRKQTHQIAHMYHLCA